MRPCTTGPSWSYHTRFCKNASFTFDLSAVTLTMERLCNFSACINSSFFKMDIITHYFIRLCNIRSLNILHLWPKCCDLENERSMSIGNLYKSQLFEQMDIVTHYPIVVQLAFLSILDHWPWCYDISLEIRYGSVLSLC